MWVFFACHVSVAIKAIFLLVTHTIPIFTILVCQPVVIIMFDNTYSDELNHTRLTLPSSLFIAALIHKLLDEFFTFLVTI